MPLGALDIGIPTRPRIRPAFAAGLAALALLASLFALVGILLIDDAQIQSYGRQALAAALLIGAAGGALGLRHEAALRPDEVMVGGMRTATLLVRVLSFAGIGVLLVAMAQHAQGLGLPDGLGITELLGAAVLALALNATHIMALGQPPIRPRTFITRILILIGFLAAAVLSLLGFLAFRGESTFSGLDESRGAASTVLLAGAVVQAIAMLGAQGLPTAREILIRTEMDVLPGNRPRSLVLPVVIAFALLVLSALLFVLFGVGVVGVLGDVLQTPAVLIAFGLLIVAIAVGVASAFRLVKSDEAKQALLYRPVTDPRAKLERQVLASSLGLALVLLIGAVGAYTGFLPIPTVAWLHLATFGILAAVGPYGFLAAKEYNRIRRLEERFPDFLREMAASHKGGLTLAESLRISARADYGPLSEEIRRMADQVAWNVPFTEALQRFAERVQTPLIQRAVNLVLEADRSGGASTDVLLAAARDAREIKTLENERRIAMSLYTIVIYVTFFVFLAVAAVLYGQFVPQLVAASEATRGTETATGASFGGETLKAEQFQLFYFLAALVQAIGDGIVAGLMGTGRAVLGLRHAFIMVIITYLTFAVFVQ